MFQTLKCTIYRIKNPQTVHIHMQDNTLFIFFKAANAPTGSFGLMWIQMQVHTVCCKDIGFLGGAGALRNLILTEICHFTDFGSRNALWGDFFFSRCPRAQSCTDASIQYRFGADGVLWALGMCQYCRWAKSPALASVEISSWFWYVTLTMLLSMYFFFLMALWLPSRLPVENSFLFV